MVCHSTFLPVRTILFVQSGPYVFNFKLPELIGHSYAENLCVTSQTASEIHGREARSTPLSQSSTPQGEKGEASLDIRKFVSVYQPTRFVRNSLSKISSGSFLEYMYQ